MSVRERHDVTVRCYETMGVPNTTATCSCGQSQNYMPGRAKREGFRDDLDAAQAWAKRHREHPRKCFRCWYTYYGWVGSSSPVCVRCGHPNPNYDSDRDLHTPRRPDDRRTRD